MVGDSPPVVDAEEVLTDDAGREHLPAHQRQHDPQEEERAAVHDADAMRDLVEAEPGQDSDARQAEQSGDVPEDVDRRLKKLKKNDSAKRSRSPAASARGVVGAAVAAGPAPDGDLGHAAGEHATKDRDEAVHLTVDRQLPGHVCPVGAEGRAEIPQLRPVRSRANRLATDDGKRRRWPSSRCSRKLQTMS